MADQEFLVSFGVDIDESGTTRLESILTTNRDLAKEMADAFDAATASIRAFLDAAAEASPAFSGVGNGITTETGFGTAGTLNFGLDLSQANKDLQSFLALLKKPVSLSANGSGIVSAARTALATVRSLFASPIQMTANVTTQGGDGDGNPQNGTAGDSPSVPAGHVTASSRIQRRPHSGLRPAVPMSTGGKFTSPTTVQVAEDGDTEYIIPVRKEALALPLLKQMLGELSPAARESLTAGGALPAGETITSMGTAGSVTINNQNVSAPVSINVNAAGEAREIGETVYNVAEQTLLRTLRGAFA